MTCDNSIWLALIDWGKTFTSNAGFVACLLAFAAWLQSWLNGRRAVTRSDDLKTTVCVVGDQVKAKVVDQIAASDAVIQHAAVAGERKGFVGGIIEGKKQASDFGVLGAQKTDFDPLSTNK